LAIWLRGMIRDGVTDVHGDLARFSVEFFPLMVALL